MNNENPKWDYEGYWNAVIGDCRNPADAFKEATTPFRTVDWPRLSNSEEVELWLTEAEKQAWAVSGTPHDRKPQEWAEYHEKALKAILRAAEKNDD